MSREAKGGNPINNWTVYILQCADGTYYTGITNDIKKRLKMHLRGKAAHYTAMRLPVKIVYRKSGYTQSEARKEEIVLKDWRREKKVKLIKGEIRK